MMASLMRTALLFMLVVLILNESDGWWRRRRRRRRSPPPCPRRNCQVGPWSGWSSCTHRCGNTGTQYRTRSKTVSEQCGGICPYQFREVRGCNRNACQNGGSPAPGYCRCRAGFKGTCCEIVIPTTPVTTTMSTTTVRPTTASTSRACGGGYLPNTKCKRDYVKIGAFKEVVNSRVMPVLLLTDRDCSSKKNDGHKLDWHKFEDSIHSLACRCAVLAKQKGWKVFGLQHYGECWSGPSADQNFKKYGKASADSSVQFLGNPLPPCDPSNPQECVGKGNVNYVYRLGPPKRFDVVNGQFSWSEAKRACYSYGKVADVYALGDKEQLRRQYPNLGEYNWLDPNSCRYEYAYGNESGCCFWHRNQTLNICFGNSPVICEKGP